MDGRAARAPAAIAGELLPKLRRQAECYRKPVISELADHGILLRRWDELTEVQREEAGAHCLTTIQPSRTPYVQRSDKLSDCM
jgi:hypothetical protein